MRRRSLTNLILFAFLAIAGLVAYLQRSATHDAPAASQPRPRAERRSAPPSSSADVAPSNAVATAFANRSSDVHVSGSGTVSAILRDDEKGSRHQKFLVALDGGPTILISHNIDLAARVEPLRKGDRISFSGEYVWNEKGGLVHWTHRDPEGRRRGGWIEHSGQRFD